MVYAIVVALYCFTIIFIFTALIFKSNKKVSDDDVKNAVIHLLLWKERHEINHLMPQLEESIDKGQHEEVERIKHKMKIFHMEIDRIKNEWAGMSVPCSEKGDEQEVEIDDWAN